MHSSFCISRALRSFVMKLKATTSRYAAKTQRTAILSEDMLPNAYRALRPT